MKGKTTTRIDEAGRVITVLPDDPAIRNASRNPYKRVASKAERRDRAIRKKVGAPPPEAVARDEAKQTRKRAKRARRRR